MRKIDRYAVFNIALKGGLFAAVFFGIYCLIRSLTNIPLVFSLLISAIPGAAVVLLFSFLLRYTRFYYGYYSFLSRFLYGNSDGKVYCPCCGRHFERFNDERYYEDDKHYDPARFSNSRQDVICDCCRSAPRHRIIASWCDKNAGLLKKSKILYFAPELSMMLWFKRQGIRVVTADLYDRRADRKLDITSTGLPSGSEDIVFCNHVLEHVSDYSAALLELNRIIRKGGMLIISFPIDLELDSVLEEKTSSEKDRIRLFGQYDHLRVFGKNSKAVLENAGFFVDTINISDMSDDIVPVTGPADYDTNMIFCCVKK